MKKTLTVNLGGMVFNIDEDAYQLLDNYLSNLRTYFTKEEGEDEIMGDFELRISELLNDRIRLGFQVISIQQIEEIIERMGRPEQIFEKNEEETEPVAPVEDNSKKVKKRLMRDPDNRILGGVASGIASYVGWDPTVVRLILIVLLFLPLPIPFPVLIGIYIILWMVVPLAKTVSDRLIMRGKSVNIENIGKAVTENFDKMSSKAYEYVHSEKPRTGFQQVADFIVAFFGVLLKIGAVLLGIVLIPVVLLIVFILFIVLIALVAGGVGAFWQGIPFIGENINWLLDAPEYITVLGSVSGILLLSIPIATLIYALCGSLLKLNPIPSGAKWVLIVIWFISLIVCMVSMYTIIGSHMHPYHMDWDTSISNTFNLLDIGKVYV